MATNGWAALGEMAAGNIGTPGVYEDALKERYSTEKALQDARRARSQALIDSVRARARQSVTPELVQSALGGDVAAQAALGASVLGSNQTMNLGQLGEYARPHYGQNINAAQEAIEAGDAATYNRFNAAALGEEFQPTIELGGAYINNGADVVAGDPFVPTAGTLGDIERDQAQAQADLIRARAAAARDNARADVYAAQADAGGFRPTKADAPEAPQIARPQSKADFDALPSGTQFIAPDGTLRIKP